MALHGIGKQGTVWKEARYAGGDPVAGEVWYCQLNGETHGPFRSRRIAKKTLTALRNSKPLTRKSPKKTLGNPFQNAPYD